MLREEVPPRGQPLTVEIRVRGRVQGVGFRPAVWRLARSLGLAGDVRNDADGVLVRVGGSAAAVATFLDRMEREQPPLGRIDHVEVRPHGGGVPKEFSIVDSVGGTVRTQVTPDAAICSQCAAEILDPLARRYRYAFTNCTHCGPRLSIVRGIPYDRARTTMAPFVMCEACRAEYADPGDRRFHAEAIACHACGPKPRLLRLDGRAISFDQHSMLDDVDAVCSLIRKGEIVAVKGLGGYQLACDATRADVVARLRGLKRRDAKPFALMARDLDVIRRYATVDSINERELSSPQAPIVVLPAGGPQRLPDNVAPGLTTLGFMLPTTPLHVLILRDVTEPVVMTSGNLSDEPQAITEAQAGERLSVIATHALVHDRAIATRLDDSVVRVMAGKPRVLRRARGYAPAPLRLPEGLRTSPDLVAMGGELKATFCLVRNGEAILSPHQGDLEEPATFDDYRRNLALFKELFDHAPKALVADPHPEYLSAKLARDRASADRLPLIEVQHHHAHVASCLAENGYPLDGPPVLGIVLDGLGWGDDATLWGGEFLLADYRHYRRLGTFKPVPMPGGVRAIREPWRNLYAHLMAEMGWARFTMNFADLDIHAFLAAKPRGTLDAITRNAVNSPPASSCGRLFDAVAAALGLARERQVYEGEAAARLEAIVDRETLHHEDDALAYPFAIPSLRDSGLPYVEPLAMWEALLGDLVLQTPAAVIAARFHKGLAKAIVAMAKKLCRDDGDGASFDGVALSGGSFQNRVLFEDVVRRLEAEGFTVFSHAEVPCNDGGLALGQAAIAAAQLISTPQTTQTHDGNPPCASASPAAS
ncbi:MAG: carbamoyltransferase HypF [Bradyrhizobiaceae bacterium]|nr:carbamoyltransferase HypF [Bradyrhizobiaceae bacterium]